VGEITNPLGTRGVAAHDGIARVCGGDLPPLELLAEVARRVRAVVPYAAAGWLLTDPATLLHTGGLPEDVPVDLHLALIDNELTAADVAKFSAVARSRRPALALSAATGGELSRSRRYRRLYAPEGYGDELRVAFRAGGVCWGVACLTRAADEPHFGDAEAGFMAQTAPLVAHGLRTGLLLAASDDVPSAAEPPGMIVLGGDGALETLTGEAERWLDELPADGLELPIVVHEVARRARATAGGPPARARVALRSGRWLNVHGALLRGPSGHPARTAVVLEPARRADLAPLIVARYDLTPREREVTRLLVGGVPTADIASALFISPHTLRDHMKAVFAKFGVTSRPELTAFLFHEQFPGL
jgi:DNA-binding CsgD family transcriptional regulator